MVSSDSSNYAQHKYKNLTEQFPKESNWKKRLSKPGRKSAKDGWTIGKEYRYGESCDLCGCSICVLGLPRPIIIWYGFAEEQCSNYIRKRNEELKDLQK